MQKIFERLGEWPRRVELVFVETVEAQFYDVGDLSRTRDERSQLVRATRDGGRPNRLTARPMDRERHLVAALRAELAAVEPARACCRRAERAGLGTAANGRDAGTKDGPAPGPSFVPASRPRPAVSALIRCRATEPLTQAGDHAELDGGERFARRAVKVLADTTPQAGPKETDPVDGQGMPAGNRLRSGSSFAMEQ